MLEELENGDSKPKKEVQKRIDDRIEVDEDGNAIIKKKRGPKLDDTVKMRICDMGNGCWTFHHFTSKIQT